MKYPLFFSDINEASNFLDIFSKKYSNIKFHEYLFSGSPVFFHTDGRTNRRDEANSRYMQFCK